MTQTILGPTFHPPKPGLFHATSDFDRCKIMLSMVQDKKEIKSRASMPTSLQKQVRATNEDGSSVLSLFGGDVVYHSSDKSKETKNVTSKRKLVDQSTMSNANESHHIEPGHQLLISDLLSPDQDIAPAKRQRNAPKKEKSVTHSVSNSQPAVPPIPELTSGSTPVKSRQTFLSHMQANHFAECASFCRNAACSSQGLAALSSLCHAAASLTIAVMWQDMTHNHVNTTTKHCTPSRPCYTWYCSCDRHIKAKRAIAPLLGVVLCLNGRTEHVYLVPLAECNNESSQSTALPIKAGTSLEERWKFVCDLLQSSVPKITYNAQLMLLPILYYSPNVVCRNLYDIKVAAFLTNTDASDTDLNLEVLFGHYHVNAKAASSLSSEVAKALYRLHDDLASLFVLYEHFYEELSRIKALSIFQTLECPVIVLLARMEITGIVIDSNASDNLSAEAKRLSASLSREATEVTGEAFNLASPEQVAHVLYDRLNLTSGSSNATKKHASTSEEDLLRIIDKHPVVELILHYRNASKLLHTTIHGMEPYITTDIAGGSSRKVYANWNQTSVRTGRLSCSKPNLQNIPNSKLIRGIELNPRSLFVASSDHILVSADYSQIEVRILAQICKDGQLIALFERSGDIYRTLAAIILDRREKDISDEERNRAKVICLGVLYGMGPQAAAIKLGIDSKAAQSIMSSFFKKFPTVSKWIHGVKRQAKVDGYVQTLLGRVRHLPDISSSDATKRSQSERQAVNSIIQGSASDIIKLAMLLVDEAVQGWDGVKPRLVMQIHDELIYEVPRHRADAFVTQLRDIMELQVCTKLQFHVPLLVKVRSGNTWGDMTTIDRLETAKSID